MTDETTAAPVQSRDQQLATIERQRAMATTNFDTANVFGNGDAFKLAVAMADKLSTSTIIPKDYADQPGNCLIAIDYAARLKVSPVMLMQNMDVVHGRPGLRGTFLAALVNNSPLFSRLKYEWRGTDNPGGEPSMDFGCRAYATEIATDDVLYGAWIDWRMVKGEGWNKNTKWTHIREQMFMYRGAAFWTRAHASDITLGLHEVEEIVDSIEGSFTNVTETRGTDRSRALDAKLGIDDSNVDMSTGEVKPAAEAQAKPRGTRRATKAREAAPDAPAPGDDDTPDDKLDTASPAQQAQEAKDDAPPVQNSLDVE